MRHFRLTFALIALAAPVAALSAQSVPRPLESSPVRPMIEDPATPPNRNPITWSGGAWDLFEAQELRFCALRLHDPESGVKFGVLQAGRGPVQLRVSPPRQDALTDSVALRLGEAVFSAPLSLDGPRVHYLTTGTAAEMFGPLTEAGVLEVDAQGRTVARFVLDGVDEALAQLSQCAAQWPDVQLPSIALASVDDQPLRPIPEPDLTGPFEPWLDPRALGQAHWIQPDDYPFASVRASEEGRVVVLVDVSVEGRAASCRVRDSSGFPRLDYVTCAVIARHARFQPATDAEGRLRPAVMAFPVNWRLNEEQRILAPAPAP